MPKRDRKKTFKPPTEAQRVRALGRTDQLNDDLRRAVTVNIDESFAPISEPEKGDWLSEYNEEGQTVQEFENFRKTPSGFTGSIIYIQPFGDFNSPRSPSLETIRRFSQLFFPGCQTELLPSVDLNPKMRQRINGETNQPQYLICDFTEHMKAMRRKRNNHQELFVVGVTMVDIYPNSQWNFVYGEASIDERIGIFSFSRFDPLFPHRSEESSQRLCTDDERRLILRRAVGTYIHEVMHLFGLAHCIYYLCLMNGANGETELDKQPLRLCPICLRKMSMVFKDQTYDVMDMYHELFELSKELGLQAEADWYRNRLQVLDDD
ncbi:unnamed protein product [Adineta ricciae]|uniref:Archaemetzincin-2 n=1 Tax=Adineta ricciae TaxID=249248 RepID=A0A814N2L1_ADIRI|nr:unnamed protein product [Adineta ricciae]